MKHAKLLVAPVVITGVAVMGYVSQRAGQAATSNDANAATSSPLTTGSKPGMVTIREYLAAYWGTKWPEIEAQIPADQLPLLDQLIDPLQIPPWDSVAPGVRAHIHDGFSQQRTAWIESYRDKDRDLILTGAVLEENARAMNAQEQLKLQAIVEKYAAPLEALAAQSFELMEEIDDDIWDKGLYHASPVLDLSTELPKPSHAELQIIRLTNAGYWHVYYTIDSSEWPKLRDVLSKMSELRLERHHEAVTTLRRA